MAKQPTRPPEEPPEPATGTPRAARTDADITRIPVAGRPAEGGPQTASPTARGPSDDDLTADALRHALDHGRGGDKVDFSDPAAAPLGTDDEAAGHPPTREQVRQAAAEELGPARSAEVPRPRRTIPSLQRDGRGIVLVLAAGLFLLLLLAVVLDGI